MLMVVQETDEPTQGGVKEREEIAMFQHILVLLDGSWRAELALPIATRIARATGASLTLLRLVTLPPDYVWYQLEPPYLAQELVDSVKLRASTYLKSKAWEIELAGIPVRTRIMPGLPLDQIQAFLEEQAIDLIILCSRGRISCRPRAQRSMALQVLQQSSVPVLVLQETLGENGTLYPRGACPVRLLVPLDGSALAETVLVPAAFLASALSAPLSGRLHLIRVLPFSDCTEAEGVIGRIKKHVKDHAETYLQTISWMLGKGSLEQANLSVTTSVVLNPNVADAIVQVAEATQREGAMTETGEGCDIIALTTHGLSGAYHPRTGSTAERILQEAHLPFLVVPGLEDKRHGQGNIQPLARTQEESEQWMD